MALFKKKNTEADVTSATSTKPQAAQKQKNGLLNLTLMLLVFILIAISISTGVQLVSSNKANHKHVDTFQHMIGCHYLSQLNDNLRKTQQASERIAKLSELATMIRNKDSEAIKLAEQRITNTLPYAINTRIIPKGRAQLDTKSDIPLTFAGLDMIKRLEKGKSTPIEFHRLNNNYYLQSVAPITNNQSDLIASLLITYDLSAALGSFYLFDSSLGELTIQQQFATGSPTLLFQQGQGNSDNFVFTQPSVIPHIILSFKLSQSRLSDPLFNENQTFFASAIACLLIVIGLFIFQYVLNQRLNKNMHMLSEFALSVTSGRKPKLPDFSLAQFASLAQALNQQNRRGNAALSDNIMPNAPDVFENSQPEAIQEMSADDLNLDLDFDENALNISEEDNQLVPAEIFRAYDIRGQVGAQLTPETLELIGQAIGSEAYERGQQIVYVGYDGRLSSPDLANAMMHGLKSTGRDVIDIGQVATPVAYFAAFTQDSNTCVMITGSHNPPEYNGIKIVIDGESLHEGSIQQLYSRIVDNDLLSGEGSYHRAHLDQEYLERIVSDIAVAQPLTVVVDAGNGVAGQYAPKLFESIGCEVIPLYCEVDGNFPNHHPDPTIEANLKDLITTVTGERADLGIAFDGDGDRLVVVDNNGNIVQPDQLMMLFAKDVLSRCPGTDIVYDVKCSNKLGAYISQQGGRPVVWKSGHSLIKSKMQELGATLGGEMSGHLVFNERWYGFDDGLYAGARLLELLSTDPRPVAEIFQDFPIGLITPEYHIETTDQHKFEIINRIKEHLNSPAATVTEIDGIRVDYDNGWGLVRASNTTPSLTLRFEGDDQDALALIIQEFKDALTQVDPSLQIPF